MNMKTIDQTNSKKLKNYFMRNSYRLDDKSIK